MLTIHVVKVPFGYRYIIVDQEGMTTSGTVDKYSQILIALEREMKRAGLLEAKETK
jgi:hypothetical protein